MAARYYTGYSPSATAGSSTVQYRGFIEVDVSSSSNTEVSYSLDFGVKATKAVNVDYEITASATGYATQQGWTYTSYSDGIKENWIDWYNVDGGLWWVSYTKGHSAVTKTFGISVHSTNGVSSWRTTKLTKTVSVTIPAKPSYTVTYNANGGTGAPGAQTKWYGENLTLQSTKPTRDGYIFKGWATSSGAVTPAYLAGGTYTGNAALSLYAVWNTAPECDVEVTSSDYYYAGVSTYSVDISNLVSYDASSISSVILTVGAQTASRTTDGSLSINLSTANIFTPTVKVTDSHSNSVTYTLDPITVYANTGPTCTTEVTSTDYYYVDLTTYSVLVSNLEAYNYKAVESVTLNVGNESDTRSTAGELSITVPETAGVYTPTVVIEDDIGATTTYTLSSITVYANTAPTCDVEVTSSDYYYAGYSTYSVEISDVTTSNYKTVSSIVLSVGQQTSSRIDDGILSIPVSTAGTFTPTVVITDSQGASSTYTLTGITVYADTAPTFTARTSSSGYYYVGKSSYSVEVSNVTPYNYKTIESVKLQVGSQIVTGTTSDTYTINVTTAGTFTPVVTVTDSNGVETTWSASSMTVYEDTPPTATLTPDTSYLPYYENVASRTYTVNLTSIHGINYKKVVKARLTVGSQNKEYTDASGMSSCTLSITPSLLYSGLFIPNVVITDDQNTSTTYTLPSITVNQRMVIASDVTLSRINASTAKLDDEGTNGLLEVTFIYSKFTGNYLLTPTVISEGSTATATWYTSWNNSTGFSGAVNWSSYQPNSPIKLYAKLSDTYSQSLSYNISITPETTYLTGQAVTSSLSQGYYLLTGRAGGKALGIGRKARTDNLLDIALPVDINTTLNGTTVGQNPKFTDNSVDQTAVSDNNDYEVLFSATADNTTRTEGAKKNSNCTFNPSTGNLQITKLNGTTLGNNPDFSGSAVNQNATSTNEDYEVLFSYTADNVTRKEEARKNSNLTFNPSTGNLQTTKLNGSDVGSNPLLTKASILDMFYPVGSYYETSDTTFNPNTNWGGTWVLETEGLVHISSGTNYVVSGAPTDTKDGGSTEVPYHNHTASGGAVTDRAAFNTNSSGTCTISSSGAHTHTQQGWLGAAAGSKEMRARKTISGDPQEAGALISSGNHTHTVPNHTHSIPAHGHGFTQPTISYAGTAGNDNMPPYIIVNRWHRTA